MALWTWWPGDPLPRLAPLAEFRTDAAPSTDELVQLTGLEVREIEVRLGAGNRCYVARLTDAPVAYGWVAAATASIGELRVGFQVATPDRYLWDFATLPAWRGRGVYPRLLQRILREEGFTTGRFWIINAPENAASAKGIETAGFRVVGDLAFARDGRAGIVPTADPERARIGAALLEVPLIESGETGGVSPCWCCVMEALRGGALAVCWPAGALASTICTCGGSSSGRSWTRLQT